MKRFIKPQWILPAIVLMAGLVSAGIRIFGGLGAATNLSDRFPWGLWVGFDVLSGVALAAGAFTLGGAVYILHIERFRPLVRAAILTGFIGYLAVIIGLMFDLGHPYRIWHPLMMWNPRSVMFEISWCVTLYTLVLAAEFSAYLFERFRWHSAERIAHRLTVPLVALGIILSTLHQSSLGSLFLIVPNKLHPLWYSSYLPVFFFLSALAIGCAMVIVESYLSSKAFKMELETDLAADLGRMLVVLVAFYGVARFLDLMGRDALRHLTVRGFERSMFAAEMLLSVIGPFVLLLMPNARRNRLGLFIGGSMAVSGFILNRFNVSLAGMIRASGEKYLPSWMELSVTFSLLVVAVFLFGLAAKYLNIFPMAKPCLDEGQTCADKPVCCLVTPAKMWAIAVWSMAFALVGAGIADFRSYRPVRTVGNAVAVTASRTSDFPTLPGDIMFTSGDASPGMVTFRHSTHVATGSCLDCHTNRFPIVSRGMPGPRAVSGDMHGEQRCGQCHDVSADGACVRCHGTGQNPDK